MEKNQSKVFIHAEQRGQTPRAHRAQEFQLEQKNRGDRPLGHMA